MSGPALLKRIDRAKRDDLDGRVESTMLALRTAPIEQGMPVSGDDRVGEACAARLLGIEG